MSRNEPDKCENEDLQPIPKEWQEISTEEIIEADYNVVPPEFEGDEEQEVQPMRRYRGRMTPPGRTPYDDSIDASSDDPGGTEHGHLFSAGYESSMATRIGDGEISDPKAERLRELHEGRHRSDGEHSVRESHRDKERIPQAICSALPLASHERQKVISVVREVDFSQFGSQKALPKVTLGVVAVVIDERKRECENWEDLISRSEEYQSIREAHEVSMSDLSTVKSKVREALDEGEVSIPRGEELPKRDPALPDPTPLDQRPRIYWDQIPSVYWAWMAQRWEHLPDAHKETIPEDYRERIDQLRKWAPWEEEVSETTSEGENTTSERTAELSREELESLRSLEKEVKEEAKELVREMGEEPLSDD